VSIVEHWLNTEFVYCCAVTTVHHSDALSRFGCALSGPTDPRSVALSDEVYTAEDVPDVTRFVAG
jgi:hypothetical protein